MQTPSFVDRMDIADDADGRVAIFTVDAAPQDPALDAPASGQGGGFHAVEDRLGAWLDASFAGVVIAAALAVVLVLGLVLLRR
jgi:hypothetical protein